MSFESKSELIALEMSFDCIREIRELIALDEMSFESIAEI